MMSDPELHYYNLSDDVIAFSTTRHGGASKGNYGELNINPYCGDDLAAITANREALCKTLDIEDSHLFLPHQVHDIECLDVTEDVLHASPEQRQQLLEGKDALMTTLPHICIGVSTADCIPVLLYDPRHHAKAAIHAGWRGTVSRIVKETFRKMQRCYGTLPEDTLAVIGPGISLKNFEVGQEVYDDFAVHGFDMSLIAQSFPCKNDPSGEKWHINLPLCNQLQLESVGVPRSHIQQSGICTYDDVADFFSARRLGINSGRIYTGII
jgi:YfiH family protein